MALRCEKRPGKGVEPLRELLNRRVQPPNCTLDTGGAVLEEGRVEFTCYTPASTRCVEASNVGQEKEELLEEVE
jgi:hypothetical protein